MKLRKLSVIWIIVAMLLAACQSSESTSTSHSTSEERNTQASESYTVVDDRGEEIEFDKVPETVVSLQPSNTEILFELGVGDKIVGVTDFDTYPEEAQNIERVSDSVNINAERIIELNPDVVFAYTIGEKESIDPLEEAGIPVFVIQSATSFDDVYEDIEQIAAVMKVEDVGEKLIEEIQTTVGEIEAKWSTLDEKKNVYYEISAAPEMYTTGNNTFQQEILNHAGVENLFADQEGWVQISEEEVIKRDPDVIFTTVDYLDDPVGEIKGREGWEDMKAIKEDQVFLLDGEILTRPGPRIGEAVKLVAESVYPELFE